MSGANFGMTTVTGTPSNLSVIAERGGVVAGGRGDDAAPFLFGR